MMMNEEMMPKIWIIGNNWGYQQLDNDQKVKINWRKEANLLI